MIDRRKFLAGLFLAPAIIPASRLMKLYVPPMPKILTDIWEDYEEGIYTPTLKIKTSGRGIDFSVAKGQYQRIGKKVFYNVITHSGDRISGIHMQGEPIIKALPLGYIVSAGKGSDV